MEVASPNTPFDTFAVILDCASLLQDEIGTCDVWAILLLDIGERSAKRTAAEGEAQEAPHPPPCPGAAERVRVHSTRTDRHTERQTESGCKYSLSTY